MNKKGFFTGLVVLGVLLIVGFFWIVGEMTGEEELVGEGECVVDEDCVKVQTGCCPCNNGGKEECVLKSEEGGYLERLENCSANTICATVYMCEIESCGCVDGRCIG